MPLVPVVSIILGAACVLAGLWMLAGLAAAAIALGVALVALGLLMEV